MNTDSHVGPKVSMEMSTYSCLLIFNVASSHDQCSEINSLHKLIPANQLIVSPSKPHNLHLIDTCNKNPTYGTRHTLMVTSASMLPGSVQSQSLITLMHECTD